MKKSFKKVGVAILAATMIMSMASAMPAFADGEATITVNAANGVTSGTCNMYLVAKVDTLGDWQWESSFTSERSFTDVMAYGETELKTLANELARKVEGVTPVATAGVGETLTTDATVANGYYLIVTTTTDAGVVVEPILINLKAGEAHEGIDMKASQIPFDKTITKVDGKTDRVSGSGDTATAASINGGQEVISYQIMSQFPAYDGGVAGDDIKDFIITDTPSDGLDIEMTTIKVFVSADETLSDADAELSDAKVAKDGRGFTVTVDGETIKPATGVSLENQFVFVTFDGKLDSTNAKLGTTGNPNDAVLTYGNEYATGQGNGRKEDRVTVFAIKAVLNKIKGDGGEVLPDAEFALYRNGNKIDDYKTNRSGQINFVGLAEGDYVLKETKAPSGYRAVSDIKFKVTGTKVTGEYNGEFSADNTFRWQATNETLSARVSDPVVGGLPGTGGMGTLLFTVGGSAIVLMAGVLFVFYMKKKKVEE